jgi:hypothetical protein
MKVAIDLGLWRDGLDHQATKDYELLADGGKCDNGVWDDKCGCTRGLTGVETTLSCSVWYLDQVTEVELMESYDKSKYADSWKLTYETFKEITTWSNFIYDFNNLSVVRIIAGKGMNVSMETTLIAIPTIDVIY